MSWLEQWLEKEAGGKQIFFYIFFFLLVTFIYNLAVVFIAYLLGIHIITTPGKNIEFLMHYFPFVLIAAAFGEEVISRLPLAIPIELGLSKKKIIASAVLLSVMFGIMHGGFVNIFLQGMAGFFYSILFLKCGGLKKKYTKALITTTAIHSLFNGIILLILLATGEISL